MIDELRNRLEEPTARSLANAVSRSVGDGVLKAGEKLPPIRAVATALNLSPTTVSAAWALLARSGAIRTDGRRGTVVADRTSAGPVRYRRAVGSGTRFDVDLSSGVPDPALLPDLAPALLRLRNAPVPQTYLDAPVVADLAAFLHADWAFAADAIVMADGAMDALDLISNCFIRFGERVAVEHPCFPPLLDLLEAVGAQILPVDLDGEGPLPDQLHAAAEAGIRAFWLQPRAQNPTGVSLSTARGEQLARVLADREVLIVENDSAGAIASSPLVSLGRWLPARTLHVRSFSKSHGPDLRLAAIGGPTRLIDTLVERRHLGQGWTSRLLQRLLLDLLTESASVDQVARARAEYARRRRVMVTELADLGVEIGGTDGLNIWLPVTDEAAALVGLASRSIGAAPGSPFAARAEMAPHLRITVGLLAEGQAEVAAAIADAVDVRASSPAR